MDAVTNGSGAATGTGVEAAGTVSSPGPAKPAKVTGKLSMTVEFVGDVDESKAYAVGIVKSLREAGLTVKAEFAETVPSKRAL